MLSNVSREKFLEVLKDALVIIMLLILVINIFFFYAALVINSFKFTVLFTVLGVINWKIFTKLL